MRLKIVQAGEPVLRQAARPLTRDEILGDEIQSLIHDMKETMHDAPGVGLAAPQVGISLQLAVIEDREDVLRDLPPQDLIERERRPVPFHAIINPRITFSGDDKVAFYEGCLSVAGFSAVVPRARAIRAEYLDERGEVARLRLPDGTLEFSSTKSITCKALSTSIACTLAPSPRSTIGIAFGRANRSAKFPALPAARPLEISPHAGKSTPTFPS